MNKYFIVGFLFIVTTLSLIGSMNTYINFDYLVDGFYNLTSEIKDEKLDKDSLVIINKEYYKDKNNVYYKVKLGRACDNCFDKTYKIKGVDPNSVEVLNSIYIKDRDNFYSCYYLATDPGSASVLCRKLKESDRDTFDIFYSCLNTNICKVSQEEYAKDKNNVYFLGKIVEGADPNTFRSLDGNYSMDDENCFVGVWDKITKVNMSKCKKLEK